MKTTIRMLEEFSASLGSAADSLDLADAAARAGSAVRAAAWDLLARFKEAAGGGVDARARSLVQVAALVLAATPADRSRFRREVLFEIASSGDYAPLATVIRHLVPLDDLVRDIAGHLEGGSDRQRANALAMQYYLFGRSGDWRLGAARRRRIGAAVARLRVKPDLGPLARAELAAYVAPEDAVGSAR